MFIVRLVLVALLSLCAVSAPALANSPTFADLAYASNWRHRLDLYIPGDRLGPFPVVAYIHGGGWLAGDKSLASRYVDALMARGFAVAAINYRFSYQATFPAQLHDCKGAIRWLRAHADEYDLDADRIAVFGESAGGHLAALVGTVFGDSSLEGNIGGNLGQSSAVQAVVDGYGPTDLFELAEFSAQRGSEISQLIGHNIYDIIAHQNNAAYAGWVALVNSADPARHAAGDDPPIFIAHGLADDVVPATQSERLAVAFNTVGASETLELLPNVGHELPASVLPGIYTFLVDQLAPLPAVLTIGGSQANEGFGQSLAVIGDVDGDGLDDLVVGAPFNDDNGVDAGRVSVHSGVDGRVLRVIRGRKPGDRFGFALTSCGDINGDGKPDFAVGAPMADVNGASSGSVDVFAGGTWKRLRTHHGDKSGDQFGTAIAAVDVDGDDVRELCVGAPLADSMLKNAGAVLIFNRDGALLRRFRGAAAGDRFGDALASAGDVDGDGRSDVIIGAPLADVGGANSGSITTVGLSAGKWTTRLVRHGRPGERFGSAVAGLGDADGDGRSDVAVGAPFGSTSVGVDAGMAYVISGSTGAVITEMEPVDGQPGDRFGSALAGAGDVDGDDLADLVVAAPNHDLVGNKTGRVAILSGLGGLLGVHDGSADGAAFGKAIAGRGNFDGIGPRDIVVAATGMISGGQRRGVVYILASVDAP